MWISIFHIPNVASSIRMTGRCIANEKNSVARASFRNRVHSSIELVELALENEVQSCSTI